MTFEKVMEMIERKESKSEKFRLLKMAIEMIERKEQDSFKSNQIK